MRTRGTRDCRFLRRCLLGSLLVLGFVAPAASGPVDKVPVLEALLHAEPRVPVVFIPGITGSKLRDRATGEVIWGRTGNLFGPHDGGRSLALPIVDLPPPGAATEPIDVIESLGLAGIIKVQIYGPLIRTLERNGYVRGNLRAPRPQDTLLVYPYDWRYGNVETARELADLLERLRKVRGEESLRVILICHSNAARIGRWYAKYGGGTLDDAAAGRAAPPSNVKVEKVIFVGTAQGGGVPTHTELDRGRVYVPLCGRTLQPESLFTMPGLFEDLPAWREDIFVDERGEALDVDLFDPASWERFGWSIYGAAARKRLARPGAADFLQGDEATRRRWLASTLDTARRVHQLLQRDAPGFGATRYYQVQNTFDPTPSRIVLVEDGDGAWRALTRDDRRVRRDAALASLAAAPGDGHATRASQEWLSPQEQAAVAGADLAIPARHRALFTHPAALRKILEFLAD